MKLLEDRIRRDGTVLPGGILKIDSFLNHCMDPVLLNEMAGEVARLFGSMGVNKILTIESSGIALAILVGLAMNCPVVYAKKSRSLNISDNVYFSDVDSYTHKTTNHVVVSKEYLSDTDRILAVDDFLATGAALRGLRDLVNQAGGEFVGAAIAVEKVFQNGGNDLRAEGMRIESLASIAAMDDYTVTFAGEL